MQQKTFGIPFFLRVFVIRQQRPRRLLQKEVKRVLGKFQGSTISPLDPLFAWPTLVALSHSPLTSFLLVLKAEGTGCSERASTGKGQKNWSGVMHREKYDIRRIPGVFHFPFPLPETAVLRFISFKSYAGFYRAVSQKLGREIEQRILRPEELRTWHTIRCAENALEVLSSDPLPKYYGVLMFYYRSKMLFCPPRERYVCTVGKKMAHLIFLE